MLPTRAGVIALETGIPVSKLRVTRARSIGVSGNLADLPEYQKATATHATEHARLELVPKARLTKWKAERVERVERVELPHTPRT
jgi:hypothetical protein